MTNATGEKAHAYDAVANNHDCGKNSIASQHNGIGPTGDHHRHDERHLNDGDSQRKYECPEWLANTMGDNFGMIDSRKNRGEQSEGFCCGEWNAGAERCVESENDE